MKWVGFALVFIGIVSPFLVFPFVEADRGQNIIIHGYLELSKDTPRYEPKNDFERVQRIVREYNAEMAGQAVEIAPYYDNPVRTAYATIIALSAPNKTQSCTGSLDTCLRRYDTRKPVIPVETGIQGGRAGALTTYSKQFC